VYLHAMDKTSIHEDVTQRCTAGRLLRAARRITREYDDALRPVDLTIAQFGLLNAVGRFEPDSISELADLLALDRTTLSRNLKPLEKAGLIFRGEEGDGRRRRLLLTTLGVRRLEEAYPLWQEVQNRIEGRLREDGLSQLTAGLKRLR